MTVHGRIAPPEGHGEVLCEPSYSEWAAAVRANREQVDAWPEPLRSLRMEARSDALALAGEYSRSRGIVAGSSDGAGADPLAPIVMTGHQPELYHPGVWVKDFLLDPLAADAGATAIDLVVDTDRSTAVSVNVPCLGPPVGVRTVTLAPEGGGSFSQSPVPDGAAREAFRAQGLEALDRLPAPALGHHFAAYCDALDSSAASAEDLADLVTVARRRYEASAGSTYLELPVSRLAGGPAFGRFAAGIIEDAGRFRLAMNEALRSFRERTATRSPAQPFPDLEEDGGLIEAPFWLLRSGRRDRVWVDSEGGMHAGDGEDRARLGGAGDSALDVVTMLREEGWVLAPRALTLTLYARLFASDLFIHGTGGGRYDRVTDAVIRSYFGVAPPRYVVASMTLLLPLGAHVATAEEVSALSQAIHRLEHNPDAMLEDVEFDDDDEYLKARVLADEKADLVEAIQRPDADRKTLGGRIREVNAALAELLEPVAADLHARLERARSAHDASEVLMDRTYAYCLWDPREVMDKVR